MVVKSKLHLLTGSYLALIQLGVTICDGGLDPVTS